MAGRLQERPDHHRQDKTSKGKMTVAGIHHVARTEVCQFLFFDKIL
jgi:hypothetical protein